MTFSFQPTCALFHLPLDCFFLCGLQVVMNLVHLSTSSCSIVPPMAIFVFSVCYIFLSDTHSQYEHTEGSLTLSDFRTYIYVRNSQTVATPVRIYVHRLCDRNIGLLTDTLRYHHTVHTRCSRASGLQPAAILQHVYQRKKSGV